MRRLTVFILILVTSIVFARTVQAAEIGSRVGSFQFLDTSGAVQSLKSYSGQVVVLVFWSFKCPVSLAYSDRMEELRSKYDGKNVAVLAITPGAEESISEVRANVANLNLRIPVFLDPDGTVAQKLGATHTPSVFVIDAGNILRYRGALDNNRRPGEKGRISYVDIALESVFSGDSISTPETRAFGCGIKAGM